ncbi:hypothetical protein GRX03_14720 [Halovenus sp. WSH3]|uniref:Uncharacterized protein n=1 Tax=Halovenus carboxidivorans TaxID=2692199 RepID=A0A6B0T441_9EURY|nr:hypothetical protein [Halovenus carboxidivorans]MXR52854.1 hypothetical protein [Halovenus carboxidivorans]
MSDTPLGAFFRLQRETIRQTEAIAEEILRAPAEVGDLFAEGVGTQRDLQEQALELSRQSIHRSLDAVESLNDGEEIESLRDSVDETFDTLQDQQDEAVESFEQRYEPLSEELIEQLGEQADLLIELNERVEDQLNELAEELPAESVPEELVEELESQLDAITEQFEAARPDDGAPEPTEIEVDSAEETDADS